MSEFVRRLYCPNCGSNRAVNVRVVYAALALAIGYLLLVVGLPYASAATKHVVATTFTDFYFSPSTTLESDEISRLHESAARARRAAGPLMIAMYAFTDQKIAIALIQEAQYGTEIDLYRDGEQYAAERARTGSAAYMLLGQANIHIRVKARSRHDMHDKAWTDGTVLREGSANWSIDAFKGQNNIVVFSTNRDGVAGFIAAFNKMWTEPANEVIQ